MLRHCILLYLCTGAVRNVTFVFVKISDLFKETDILLSGRGDTNACCTYEYAYHYSIPSCTPPQLFPIFLFPSVCKVLSSVLASFSVPSLPICRTPLSMSTPPPRRLHGRSNVVHMNRLHWSLGGDFKSHSHRHLLVHGTM